MKKEVDFNIFKAQILEEIKAGKPLFGKDGALAPMIENIVNAVLEGEMDAHLTQESRESGNRRNGKMQKQVQTPVIAWNFPFSSNHGKDGKEPECLAR